MVALPNFDSPGLAQIVEAWPADRLDQLPFGAIYLDETGIVRLYNRARAEQSGRGAMPTVGLPYFADVAPCLDNGYFKGRIDRARVAGALDISFSFIGDFNDRDREIAVRALAGRDGGTWIFIQIPETSQ